ncbi:RHS repeat domain-containing protein [Pedobacter yonginense]|uniref:RHS repeat domain-containing protein n=1 Tax=Pedobacter yonginense TaxID=651869 RepID=UPI001F0BBE2D|nr:RHS repeat-associated core domain-containing protein [Pedobacter yonginense]
MTREGFGTNNYTGYEGNKLKEIKGFTNSLYTYDVNGNLKTDSQKGNTLQYNYLNLPSQVTGSQSISYTYDATGKKLKKVSAAGTVDYVDGIQYKTGNIIDCVQTEEGIARNSNGNYTYEYNLSDHLGNVRASFYKNPNTQLLEVLQRDNYYAFGLRKSAVFGNNKYLYNGKEIQEELGEYDYGARFYDPVIGRWNVVDPLAEFHFNSNPYNYVLDNPIAYMDPFGLDTVKTNQLVPPAPGVTPFNPNVDVIQLDDISVVVVRPVTTSQDNTRNNILPLAPNNAILAPGQSNPTLNAASQAQTAFDLINEVNPKMCKFAPYSGGALKVVDLMNSRNGKEAQEKVLSFAIEQIGAKLVGSGTGFTALQGVHYYYNNTLRGLSEMANAENKEMLFNRNMYRVSGDEVYIKRESQANKRMYEYLNKMREIMNQDKR